LRIVQDPTRRRFAPEFSAAIDLFQGVRPGIGFPFNAKQGGIWDRRLEVVQVYGDAS
jgi:hypothetical protein